MITLADSVDQCAVCGQEIPPGPDTCGRAECVVAFAVAILHREISRAANLAECMERLAVDRIVYDWFLMVIDGELVEHATRLLERGLPLEEDDPVAAVLIRLHKTLEDARGPR